MTGPEHYREAERLLKGAKTNYGALVIEEGTAEVFAAAQAHATLALAAATAQAAPIYGEPDSAGMATPDAEAWDAAAGVPTGTGHQQYTDGA